MFPEPIVMVNKNCNFIFSFERDPFRIKLIQSTVNDLNLGYKFYHKVSSSLGWCSWESLFSRRHWITFGKPEQKSLSGSMLRFWKDQLVTPQTLSFRVFTWHQEKNKDKGEREGGSWFNPWDLSISPKLFTDSLSSQNGSYYSGNSSIGLPRSKCYITINGEMAERAEMAFAMNAVW